MICRIYCRGLSSEIHELLGDLERKIAVGVMDEKLRIPLDELKQPWFFVEVRNVGDAGVPFCRVEIDDIPLNRLDSGAESAISTLEGLVGDVFRERGVFNVPLLVTFHLRPPHSVVSGLCPVV
ncbi:MAG: hypothetical protein Q7S57_00300 [bacterium]|nr:hypothetical protein [bacterium]